MGDDVKSIDDSSISNYMIKNYLDGILLKIVESEEISNDSFSFLIKFFNNILVNKCNRSKFITNKMFLMICSYFEEKKLENKKEIAKYILTIS